MPISFLHGGLLAAGAAAVAVPIVIHLLLRQRPKPVRFPALRFLMDEKNTTVRKLKLRNWLLLALRALVLLALAAALARPRWQSDMLPIDQDAPVSMMLVIDNSPSMGYRLAGKTLLETAAETARTVLEKMPDDSEVTIVETSTPATTTPLSVGNAISRLDKLEIGVGGNVPRALDVALRGLGKGRNDRREVYVLSDMAANAWPLSDSVAQALQRRVENIETGVRLYAIDVGVEEPATIGLGLPQLAEQVLPADAPLQLAIDVPAVGPEADVTVDLSLDGEARDSKQVLANAEQPATLEFAVRGLSIGTHQGEVRLVLEDPLEFDDRRYFTVEVRPAVRALVVSDEPADAINFAYALAPPTADPQGVPGAGSAFDVKRIVTADLPAEELAGVRVLALINVAALDRVQWQRLGNYVRGGGSLFVALGDRVNAGAYNDPAAQALLPAEVGAVETAAGDLFLSPDRLGHPVLQPFVEYQTQMLLATPVRKYMAVTPAKEQASVIMPYGNGDPALLERQFGQGSGGRVLMLTTAAHYRPNIAYWSELPITLPYWLLVRATARYLSGLSQTELNFLAGGPASFALPPEQRFSSVVIRTPDGEAAPQAVPPGDAAVYLPEVRTAGQYRVTAREGGRRLDGGFSVNVDAAESDLTRVDMERLVEVLGVDRTSVARDPGELDVVVAQGRVGRELFRYLMFLVLVVVCAEGYLANRFYDHAEPAA